MDAKTERLQFVVSSLAVIFPSLQLFDLVWIQLFSLSLYPHSAFGVFGGTQSGFHFPGAPYRQQRLFQRDHYSFAALSGLSFEKFSWIAWVSNLFHGLTVLKWIWFPWHSSNQDRNTVVLANLSHGKPLQELGYKMAILHYQLQNWNKTTPKKNIKGLLWQLMDE